MKAEGWTFLLVALQSSRVEEAVEGMFADLAAQLIARRFLAHPINPIARIALVDNQNISLAAEECALGEPVLVDMENHHCAVLFGRKWPHVQPLEVICQPGVFRDPPTNGQL